MVADILGFYSENKKDALLRCFLTDFPYKAGDFNGVNPGNFRNKECSGLFADLVSVALLVVDKNEETEEIRELKAVFQDKSDILKKFSGNPCRCAALFFPLMIPDKEFPSWGLVVKSDDNGTLFFDAYQKKWCESWNYEPDGSSCRLAETLAEKLVHEGTQDQIVKAAKSWIVTGDIDENGKVGKVGLGNKLKLPTKRKFIVPDANYDEISRGTLGKTIRFANTLNDAWNHVTDQGTKHLEGVKFSRKVDELHVLVGGNIKAQVASIILLKPEKVFLWHSKSKDESKKPAKWIAYVAKKYAGIRPEIKFLTSKKIDVAEKALKDHFENISPDKTVVFNVTSGNRLMSYAVQTIANAYRNVELIYRDIDEKIKNRGRKYYFTRLLYNEFPPFSGRIWVKLDDKINDDFLCSKAKDYKDGKDFYNKLIKKEANDE